MQLVNEIAELYAAKFSSPLDEVLTAIEAETLSSHAHPHMLSGHVQGLLLQMISSMVRPMRILEIGTFTGFSAICLAKGLLPGGKLHTVELREDDAILSKKNFERAGLQDTIVQHTGDAKQLIPEIDEAWDIVFIDADKPSYIQYYNLTLPKLKSGGFIIADNVLFHGEILNEEVKGKNAKAIHAFNETVAGDNRVEVVIATVRDGLSIIKKK